MLEEVGPQRSQTQGGHPEDQGGAQPLSPLGPGLLRHDKLIYGYPNNHADGLLRTHGGGSNPANPRGTF